MGKSSASASIFLLGARKPPPARSLFQHGFGRSQNFPIRAAQASNFYTPPTGNDLGIRGSAGFCRAVIESQWYKNRWGDRFSLAHDQNTRKRLDNDKGGYRMITSVESKGSTSFGANIIILDNCNSAKEIESEAVIESTTDWFDGTLAQD